MNHLLMMGLLSLAVVFGAACSGNRTANEGADQGQELISYISHGEEVDIAAAVPKSGLVVVEFTADW